MEMISIKKCIFIGLLAFLGEILAQTRPELPPQGNSSTTTRPDPSSPSPSIIYGTPADEGEIPFYALLYNAANGSTTGTRCGGALIHPLWVLTAGHCINPDTTDYSEISMGSVRTENMHFSTTSYERFRHENYSRPSLLNDIGLIKLSTPAQGENIATIPLPARDVGTLEGETFRASGYGLTEQGSTSEILLKVNLIGISNADCNQNYGGGIADTNLCARYSTRPGESTCYGDSGGPMDWNNNGQITLVGLTSTGSRTTCDSGDPPIFVRVSEYIDWIENTIAANS